MFRIEKHHMNIKISLHNSVNMFYVMTYAELYEYLNYKNG